MNLMTLNDRAEIEWAPKVSLSKIRMLNLLQGSTHQILELLNGLAYGENTAPELLANRAWWRPRNRL